jgi:POT family proton-dependent oligopeptide transporter
MSATSLASPTSTCSRGRLAGSILRSTSARSFSICSSRWLLEPLRPGPAFGVPAALMLLATFIFWAGPLQVRPHPAEGPGVPAARPSTPRGLAVLGRLAIIFAFVAVFWSLWDQSGGEWVRRRRKWTCTLFGHQAGWLVPDPGGERHHDPGVHPAVPIRHLPAISKVFPLTPLRKIGLGIVTGLSFLVSAWIEAQLAGGPEAQHRLAAARLRAAVRRRGHGVDHGARVRLHPGAEDT